MTVEIKVPEMGESITEGVIAKWLKSEGDSVTEDEPVLEVETDKITVEIPAPQAGTLSKQGAHEGDTVKVGDVVGEIDESGTDGAGDDKTSANNREDTAPESEKPDTDRASESETDPGADRAMPAARAEAERLGVDLKTVDGTGKGGRILKEDVQGAAPGSDKKGEKAPSPPPPPRESAPPAAEERKAMTPLRRRVAERLVQAQQTAALLTTFNEVDMSAVIALRKRYKEAFIQRHGVKLGFMSFFVKAAVDALRQFPSVNAEIDGTDVIYKYSYNIGVAVGGGKGLVVPVIKNAGGLGFAEIEKTIGDFGQRARDNKLTLPDLQGGTFTISNGGVYGSMLSTPIINPPQTGILGLHNIVERPVAMNGQVEIRPVMYLALSYDHRLVDGREAVQFLVTIKDNIEDPERMLLEV